MAAQGQSFFDAAGDGGHWVSGTGRNGFAYPCEDDYVICVGGTELTTNGAGGSWESEIAWPDSGGGISIDGIPIPSWQQLAGVITSKNEGSTTLRNGPDVAAEANTNFYWCADGECGTGEGGTSFAAPMWAGYLALANQQAVANGTPAPGFIDPAIYPLGLGSGYATAFHDITSGNNGFPAVPGYDLVTGWGSPNGAGLINALTGPPAQLQLWRRTRTRSASRRAAAAPAPSPSFPMTDLAATLRCPPRVCPTASPLDSTRIRPAPAAPSRSP